MDDERAADRLFVYGSLTDRARRRGVIGREIKGRAGTLRGYMRRRGRYFYVVPDVDSEVLGLILEGIGLADWTALDAYEETPALYTRELVTVIDDTATPVCCWCYLPTAAAIDA